MRIDEWLTEHRKKVDNMTLEAARNVVAKSCAHDDMRIEFEKAVKMLLDCADNTIKQTANATNGDVLCLMFPNMHYTLSDKSPRVVTTIGVAASFDIDWWNSPYKREGEQNAE